MVLIKDGTDETVPFCCCFLKEKHKTQNMTRSYPNSPGIITYVSTSYSTQRNLNSLEVCHRFAMRRICIVNGKVFEEDEGLSVILLILSLKRTRYFNKD